VDEVGSFAWLLYLSLVAMLVFRVLSHQWNHSLRSWGWRRSRRERERFVEEMRTHRRVPLAIQQRRARELGYSEEPVDWAVEPLDWRIYPLPDGALEGLYHPEHVATSMRELAAARSQHAAQAAIRRVEHAVGDPDHFVHFPAALPASQRLLDVLVDREASAWARWAAASVLTTLLEGPDPGIQLGGPSDDTSQRTHQAILGEVRERAGDLRDIGLTAEPTETDEPPIGSIVRHVLWLAGADGVLRRDNLGA